MTNTEQRGAISERLTTELTYLIRERAESDNSDETISFLLGHELHLVTLVFCRCRVKSQKLAAEIEGRILENSFCVPLLLFDLIEMKDSLLNDTLKQKLYRCVETLLDEHRYFSYPWLVAQKYPELRERVGEWFLADDHLDLVQIDYTMQFYSAELQERIIQRIRHENQYPLFEMLKNSSVS